MPFNPQEILDAFQNLESLSPEAKDKLTSLNNNLKYVAPELIKERLFYGYKSQPGLCYILQEHAAENKEAIELYAETMNNIDKDE